MLIYKVYGKTHTWGYFLKRTQAYANAISLAYAKYSRETLEEPITKDNLEECCIYVEEIEVIEDVEKIK
jgi:hypothetical protein